MSTITVPTPAPSPTEDSEQLRKAFEGKIRDSSFMHSDISNTKRPNAGTDVNIEQTPCSFLNHRGKDGESRGHSFQKAQLENGMVSEVDAEVDVECEREIGTSGRNYSGGSRKTRLHMFGQKESSDASTCDKDCNERTHSFWINYTKSPLPSDVDEKEDTERPKKSEYQTRADDMNVFSIPRVFVRSLKHHSSPKSTSRKSQSKNEFTDFTDGNYDEYDALRGENNRQMTDVLKGQLLLDKLESVADGLSDRSNSIEGSVQNSSVWSESVQRSNSLSPSSSNLFQDVSGNDEDYLTTLPTVPDEGTSRMDDMNCHTAEVDSVEGSVDSSEFEETSAFCRGRTKVMYCIESVLGGSLCAVLAVPVTMVVVKLFSMQEQYHVMLPT
ncbi:hypothetical protein KI387_043429 [Taxus chinensis]|uniref:Uncharacterized protein n=1 Tax=Taxus chinensis TaxID=29808 RepID=A0AA38BYZ9_TAXCH|nr:hypothetical protein KI387_043429 [Taxus chinensis]